MVVRIPNWLGDALMATPVYYNLCKSEELWLFGPDQIVDLFKNFPNTKIIYYKKGSLKENIKTLKPLKNQVGVLLPNSFSSAWLFFRARLRERWGYSTDLRRFLLTKAIKPPKKKLHQKDYYLYLLKKLKLPCNFKDLILPISKEEILKAENLLKGISKNFIVLAPGAAYGPAKMWPKENYKALAEFLVKSGYSVIITGGIKEKETGEYIKQGLQKVYNLCGKTDLSTVAGIFYLAKLIISNDSGLMHLAAALKVPQIAIFGSTDPEATGPLNPNAIIIKKDLPCSPCFKRTCKYKHYNCLKSISVEEVMNYIRSFLS